MFDKKTKSYTDLLGKTNRIVEGTTIEGNIVSQADFRLDGILTGNFKSNGKLVIGPAATVTGDVVCKNCDIEGKYHGNIQVAEMLTVKAKASIKGAVVCGKLSVEPCADFSASCEMKPHLKSTTQPNAIPKPTETNA